MHQSAPLLLHPA